MKLNVIDKNIIPEQSFFSLQKPKKEKNLNKQGILYKLKEV